MAETLRRQQHVNLVGERPSPVALRASGELLMREFFNRLGSYSAKRKTVVRDAARDALVDAYILFSLEARERYTPTRLTTKKREEFETRVEKRSAHDMDYAFDVLQVRRALGHFRDATDGSNLDKDLEAMASLEEITEKRVKGIKLRNLEKVRQYA